MPILFVLNLIVKSTYVIHIYQTVSFFVQIIRSTDTKRKHKHFFNKKYVTYSHKSLIAFFFLVFHSKVEVYILALIRKRPSPQVGKGNRWIFLFEQKFIKSTY